MSIYKQVSVKRVIADVIDRGFTTTDWYNRAPEWVGSALAYMKIHNGLISVTEEKEVVDYKCMLPCALVALIAIEYNGERLSYASQKNHHDTSDFANVVYAGQNTYTLNRNNYAQFNFETGTVKIHYKSIPVDEDGFPLVPDDERLLDALSWFVMKRIILRGFKHPELDYKMCEQMWMKTYPMAQNSVKSVNSDERELIYRLWASMPLNKQANKDYFFRQSYQ